MIIEVIIKIVKIIIDKNERGRKMIRKEEEGNRRKNEI